MKNCITMEELEAKKKKLIEEYNDYMEKGRKCFAEHSLKHIDAVRYVMELIKMKN